MKFKIILYSIAFESRGVFLTVKGTKKTQSVKTVWKQSSKKENQNTKEFLFAAKKVF
jgi:hypothetical protein